LDGNDDYEIHYLGEGERLAWQQVRRVDGETSGLVTHVLNVPPEAVRQGYDTVRILPLGGDKRYRLGGMRLR
jgi:hypothetical protein